MADKFDTDEGRKLCFSNIIISAKSFCNFEAFRSALNPTIQECLKNNVIIDFISADQIQRFPYGENVIQIATDGWGLKFADSVGFTFFVGPNEMLTHKYRNTVPLVDQGLQGIENIINYAKRIICERVLTYKDIIELPNKALDFYERQDTPSVMRDRALSASIELSETFPNIQAIFGGGYPFYLVKNDDLKQLGPPLDSIFKYLIEQKRYFRQKAVSKTQFSEAMDKKLSTELLDQLNLFFGYNRFDEFSEALQGGMKNYFLGSYYKDNGFDLIEDIWPCPYCTHFNDPVFFPDLTVKRGFNEECTPCKQTALKLRNIMGCIADVDLVIVVKDNLESNAHEIENFMRHHPEHFVYDTRPKDTVLNYKIPLDAFVITEHELETAFNKLSSGHPEEDIQLEALALWLPIKPHRLDLGTNFALSFELLSSRDSKWHNLLQTVRHKYASIKDPKELVQRLQNGSLYHQQLLEVSWISKNLVEKLDRWKTKKV